MCWCTYQNMSNHPSDAIRSCATVTLRGKESVAEDSSTVGRVLKGNPGDGFTGNGNPNQGPDGCKKVFQFNMLGHPKDASIPECSNEGKRIFVERSGQNQVRLYICLFVLYLTWPCSNSFPPLFRFPCTSVELIPMWLNSPRLTRATASTSAAQVYRRC